MVDHISEILLTGRTIAAPTGDASDHIARVVLPSFVAGPENRLVATAVGSLMRDGDRRSPDDSPSPAPVLALNGSTGAGKTHLALGLVRYWQDRHGSESAEYFTAGDFRRALTDAIDHDAVVDFRRRVRGRQLLAIDDLHHLSDDPYLLQELRYTLDDLSESAAAVVVTTLQPVGSLPNLPPDLRSRLSCGLVLQLAPGGQAARRRLAQQCAAALGRPLADRLADRLARDVPGTARELFGAVFELCANAGGAVDTGEKQVDRMLANRAARRPTLREIIPVVAKYYGQPRAVLKSASRRQSAVLPRAVAVYLARELSGLSYDQIGRALGGRDHTTIMHNYRKIDRARNHDLTLQEALADLRRILVNH